MTGPNGRPKAPALSFGAVRELLHKLHGIASDPVEATHATLTLLSWLDEIESFSIAATGELRELRPLREQLDPGFATRIATAARDAERRRCDLELAGLRARAVELEARCADLAAGRLRLRDALERLRVAPP